MYLIVDLSYKSGFSFSLAAFCEEPLFDISTWTLEAAVNPISL